MRDPAIARAYLESEVEALEPFGFVAVGPASNPMHLVEVTRREDQALEVRIPGRPMLLPDLPGDMRKALGERDFVSEDPADRTKPWVQRASDAAAAVQLAGRVLTEVFEEKTDAPFDIAHGSHRAEHEARKKLGEVRDRVEHALAEMSGAPLEKDSDGDYLLPVNDVHVMVAPRVVPGGIVVVRVFAITNVGVNVAPELGLFLARLNFGLMFGRFALDAENRSIWFDETLLGDQLNDDALRFTVRVVASTADEWDDRLKQMFGGETHQEVLGSRTDEPPPQTKPGQGGYL